MNNVHMYFEDGCLCLYLKDEEKKFIMDIEISVNSHIEGYLSVDGLDFTDLDAKDILRLIQEYLESKK